MILGKRHAKNCNFCGVSAIVHRWDKNCRFETKTTVFGISTAVLRINRRFKGDSFVSAIFGDFSSLVQKLPYCEKSCRFGTKFAVFRTLTAVWGIKCRFRDDIFVRAIFGNFFKFLRQFFQILTAKLGCPSYK